MWFNLIISRCRYIDTHIHVRICTYNMTITFTQRYTTFSVAPKHHFFLVLWEWINIVYPLEDFLLGISMYVILCIYIYLYEYTHIYIYIHIHTYDVCVPKKFQCFPTEFSGLASRLRALSQNISAESPSGSASSWVVEPQPRPGLKVKPPVHHHQS